MGDDFQSMNPRFRDLILDASGDGVYGVDAEGRTMFANPAAERLCGYTLEEMLGRSPHELTHHSREDGSHYPATECPIYAAFRDGKVHRVDDEVFWRKDGTCFPVEYISTPIIEDGQILGAVVSFRDITRRRTAEQELELSLERAQTLEADLHHVSRLSAMGELASGLAHELNQPLTAVSSYVNAARRYLEKDSPDAEAQAIECMDKAAAQALRAGEIIRRIRQFVTKGEGVKTFEEVESVVREAVSLVASVARANSIGLDVKIDAAFEPLLMDRIRIQQVIVNLVRNAIEALSETQGARIEVSAAKGAKHSVRITVRDNGPGISREMKAQLFEPFVTSKASGMGIGLSICRSIVEEHGGLLTFDENLVGGASFSFSLPDNAG